MGRPSDRRIDCRSQWQQAFQRLEARKFLAPASVRLPARPAAAARQASRRKIQSARSLPAPRQLVLRRWSRRWHFSGLCRRVVGRSRFGRLRFRRLARRRFAARWLARREAALDRRRRFAADRHGLAAASVDRLVGHRLVGQRDANRHPHDAQQGGNCSLHRSSLFHYESPRLGRGTSFLSAGLNRCPPSYDGSAPHSIHSQACPTGSPRLRQGVALPAS